MSVYIRTDTYFYKPLSEMQIKRIPNVSKVSKGTVGKISGRELNNGMKAWEYSGIPRCSLIIFITQTGMPKTG